ncbi:MAG: YifB family Mg chelatase-like AAA ATPase [Bacteroidales bacterium]|nr:YifB family Mg chelatase-like AAA ATPase [Bacteroidales bacterium]MBP5317141.1 YifB family Mg chelatase-like AAA ATPase [Bacteroidales bacterium]
MLCKTYCATCLGLTVVAITVETDISNGIGIQLVGLPDSAVKESLTRVLTAIRSYGYRIPGKRIVINLAPADIKKQGSSFDLAIAMTLICAIKEIEPARLRDHMFLGELALDGSIRDVPGALPIAVYARDNGFSGCILPFESAKEAVDIEGVNIYGVRSLADVLRILLEDDDKEFLMQRGQAEEVQVTGKSACPDFKVVKGQQHAKRGFEIAAAGGHNIILIGSPGCGKTLMASCLPSILPPMETEESIETSKIYSVAGKSIGSYGLLKTRPFRTPHNSASRVSLLGGGPDALPGEISLAHNGVLYLDEIAQFSKVTLDLLRQPLEDGKIVISRARYRIEYPCSYMLVASMNPCPCGYYGDPSGRCRCTQSMVDNYMARISGPLMDRIDMHIYVDRVAADDLTAVQLAEPSAAIAERVSRARKVQLERFRNEQGVYTNSKMNAEMMTRYCKVGSCEQDFLCTLIDKLSLSARAYGRVLKLARTIADLAGEAQINMQAISEAIQYRNLDRLER